MDTLPSRACVVILLAIAPKMLVASQETIGPNGIDSAGLTTATGQPLTGGGVGIGLVEDTRPGKRTPAGPDNFQNSNGTIVPEAVYLHNNPNTPPANMNIDNHVEYVAGIMISSDPTITGVAPAAELYASGYVGDANDDEQAAQSSQFIATRNFGDVHAINYSFLFPFDSEPLDGNDFFTLFVDWSVAHHDVLYVVAGTQSSDPGFAVPSENFNGITVAASTQIGGVYTKVADFNTFADDAEGFRTSTSLLAPGDAVDVTGLGDLPNVELGTSFAAPHVTGAVALLQHYVLDRINTGAPRFDATRARRHEVMKAVLLNSADKLAGVHGSTRTILDQDDLNWLQSEAMFDELVPLDDQMGAGHLNVRRAVQQISSGEYDPDGIFGVPVIGWDYHQTSGVDDINKYVFDEPLLGGSYVAITIAFDRGVILDNDSGIIGEYDAGDTFAEYSDFSPHADDVINDLDLYLLPKDATEFADAIALSISPDSTIDHIFAQIPTTGEYEFWVHQFDQDFFGPGQEYAVAWWAVSATPVTGDYSGNGTVGPEDYAVWTASYGDSVAAGSGADGSGNGVIDAADYVIWRKALTGGSGGLAAVPEPAGGVLFLVAGVMTVLRVRSRAL